MLKRKKLQKKIARRKAFVKDRNKRQGKRLHSGRLFS